MKKKISLLLLCLSVASLGGTIATMVIYFINKSKVNSLEFIKAIKETLETLL